MLDELEEFRAYTDAPVYSAAGKRDTAYLGRFTYDMLLRFEGLARVLTIMARGYLWQNGESDIERARSALCAWCSIPEMKKASPREGWQFRTDYRELHVSFPELVDEEGRGWFYRHVHGICDLVKAHPEVISKPAQKNSALLRKGFDEAWRKKVEQFQIPLFHEKTRGAWVLRFDDVLAEAKEQGPLQNHDVPLPANTLSRLHALTPEGVPKMVLPTLVQYYLAHKQPDTAWVVLPVTNFDAFFGNTSFSRKWLRLLPESVIQRDETRRDPCRYMVTEEISAHFCL